MEFLVFVLVALGLSLLLFHRLTAALSMDGKGLSRKAASAEEFADVVRAGAEEPEGSARVVGNG